MIFPPFNSFLQERVQICDSHVNEHENYRIKLERFQDWLRSLKAAVDTNVDHGDTEGLKMKLIALSVSIMAYFFYFFFINPDCYVASFEIYNHLFSIQTLEDLDVSFITFTIH